MLPPFHSSADVFAEESRVIGQTFTRQRAVWTRGEGCFLWDKEGRKALDFFSGHGVMALGYAHPAQSTAMSRQASELMHTGNLYYTEAQVDLARRLVAATFGDKVFFANSGAEIVELAIKLARKWARREKPSENRFEIVALKGSFHGRTYGALSATGQEKYQKGLDPMLPGFKHVPANNFVALASAITNATCAVLVEPIQGESGVRPLERDYLQAVRTLCDQNHLLLIFDEIQCGLGRAGARCAYETVDVTPDVMLLGKALGGGLPISALVAKDDVASALQVGDHGSTFGGNPVAAAGGCVLLDELARPALIEHVRLQGAAWEKKLNGLKAAFPKLVTEVRGRGLMWGMELSGHAPEAVSRALNLGLVINCAGGNTLRFLPPLILSTAEAELAGSILAEVLKDLPA